MAIAGLISVMIRGACAFGTATCSAGVSGSVGSVASEATGMIGGSSPEAVSLAVNRLLGGFAPAGEPGTSHESTGSGDLHGRLNVEPALSRFAPAGEPALRRASSANTRALHGFRAPRRFRRCCFARGDGIHVRF